MTWFQYAKVALAQTLHLARDALHIHVALILFFGAMLLFGWRANQWKPWLLVLAFALLGEAWDIYDTFMQAHMVFWAESRKDIVNTMVWPTAILLLARHTGVFGKRR